jgi:hypothetical protein
MRSALVVLAAAVLAVPVLGAQDSTTVRGRITQIGPSTLTVQVDAKDMTFLVDNQTQITVRGGTTKTLAAKAEGKAGTTLGELLKAGESVEVQYVDAGGKMRATAIRAGVSVGSTRPSPSRPTNISASGIVTAVTMSSLAIKSGDKAMTFTIDKTTEVIARGASTILRQKQAEGAKGLLITDTVHAGDTVTVLYHEADGKMLAATVRVTAQAKK